MAGFWGRIFSLSEFWKSFSELGPYLASCHNGDKYFCNFTFWFSCVILWSHENIYESLKKHQASIFLLVVQPYIEETQTFYLPKKKRVKFDLFRTSFCFFCYLLSSIFTSKTYKVGCECLKIVEGRNVVFPLYNSASEKSTVAGVLKKIGLWSTIILWDY